LHGGPVSETVLLCVLFQNRNLPPAARTGLHDATGHRLYLTAAERAAFLVAAQHFPREGRTLCVILHSTGCRVSEALSLTPDRVDFSGKAVVFETLKKRKRGVFRTVPVPDTTLDLLAMVHGLRERQQRPQKMEPLWPWSRITAWRPLCRCGARNEVAAW
jgi:integrase